MGGLTHEQCYAASAAMMKSAPRGKEGAAEVLALLSQCVVREGLSGHLASAIAAWYALLACGPASRKPVHLYILGFAFLCATSDASFAGLPFALGTNGLNLSEAAKAVLAPLAYVWTLIAVLNGVAFFTCPKEKTA